MQNISTVLGNSYICWDLKIKYVYYDYGFIEAKLDSFGGICKLANLDKDNPEFLKHRNLDDS